MVYEFYTLLPMTAPRMMNASVGWQPKVTFSCQPEAEEGYNHIIL